MGGTTRRRNALVVVAVLAAAAAAVGCTEDRPDQATTLGSTPSSGAGTCTTSDLLTCARASTIADLVPDTPTKATGEPITIGMINQENTPAGSFPELSAAAEAGIEFVNTELGGVGGRPLELEVCNTKFSAEGSTACGQQFAQEQVPVVLGGIDVFGNGIEVLESNAIPFVGGIPISDASVRSANSFQWSGGIWGANVAFADYAARELHAEKAAIVYGEFGTITEAAEFGKSVLENAGVDQVQLIPHPIITTDLSSPVQVATAADPDVIFMLEADTGCKGAFDAIANSGTDATVFYVGACAAPPILEQAGPDKTNGAIFNVESLVDVNNPAPDMSLYMAVAERYGNGFDPIGAGTVSFKSFMNLYAVLVGLGPDGITPQAIADTLAEQVDTPSFLGHAYTCDGEQFADLTAMCAPQQILAQLTDGQLHQLGTWIDVGAVYGDG